MVRGAMVLPMPLAQAKENARVTSALGVDREERRCDPKLLLLSRESPSPVTPVYRNRGGFDGKNQ
jgi:hypothetical protein